MLTTSQRNKTAITMAEDIAQGGNLVAEERRSSVREKKKLSARIGWLGCSEAKVCPTEDVSESGLFVCLPNDIGLRVGQRCEVVLSDNDPPPANRTDGESVYATVVRTHAVKRGAQQFTGAGLRFDQPLFL